MKTKILNKIWDNIGKLAAIATLLGFIIVVIPFMKSCQVRSIPPEEFAKIGRISVGFIPYFEMTSNEAKNGELKGFLIDVFKKFSEDFRIPSKGVEFYETDWANFTYGLKEGKYDLCIGGTFRTPEREKVVAFTEPLFYLGSGALVRKEDNRFNSIEDLNNENITIAVVIGEQGYEYANKYLSKAKLKVLSGSNLETACLELEKGSVDATLSDQYIIRRFLLNHPNFKDAFEDKPYNVLPICWAVRYEDKEWLRIINSEIIKLKESGWIQNLQKYYPIVPWANSASYTSTPIPNMELSENFISFIIKYGSAFVSGMLQTIIVSFFSIVLGTLLGAILALLSTRRKGDAIARTILFTTRMYIHIFLAIPALALIIILYYNNVLTGLNSTLAAIIALGLNLSPFAARIIETGIKNIEPMYLEAAKAFGFSDRQLTINFKLPMLKRNSLQPLLVQWFTTIKLSSLSSVIGVTEILHRSQQVIRETYQTEYTYIAMLLCYAMIVVPVSILAERYERKLIVEEKNI